jgi:hypothetical protein
VTLSGTYLPNVPTISRAVATIIGGTATIPTATYASIRISPSQSLSVQGVEDLNLDLDTGASVYVEGGLINLDAQNGGSTVTMIAQEGQASLGGLGTTGDINFIGQQDNAYIYGSGGAEVRMDGSFYQAYMIDQAVGTAYGSTVKCEAYTVSPTFQRG